MKALLVIALLSFEWYGPGGGALRVKQPKVTQPKVKYEYRWRGNYYYLKLEERTYWGYGVPQWMKNPYVPSK